MSTTSISNAMNMECENKNERGVFVRKRTLLCGTIFVIAALTIVALLAHYMTRSKCGKLSANTSGESSVTTPGSSLPIVDFRLPKNFRPHHYQLRLQPFLNNYTFSGYVNIYIECLEDTDVITIHSNNLTLLNESIHLFSYDDKIRHVTSYDHDLERQFLIFNLNDTLHASNIYNLSLMFNGVLGDNLVGFYRSKYDKDSWMATTQFEPTDARRAFPCFDEPGMKARFTVSLVRLKGYISISNMPRNFNSNEKTNDDWEIDEYLTTPNMSTYLLAFIVTNFSYADQKSVGDVEFRVYSRPAAKDQTKFAVETGPLVLDFFDDFFNIPYPLPKQDMIAIPDFGSGAMENWGLITYREATLLFDSTLSSIQNKENIAIVIAHELAHQWFGNLVTPAWWDDLWLNEGFATYMEYVAVDHLFQKWKTMERFSSTLHWVLEEDSLKSSHAISVTVENPDQINEMFDSISYNKGASIIRMMVNFLGNEVFKEGLKTYFEENKYKNAVQDDLWRHMTQAAKNIDPSINVKEIMDTWTVQTGYPVVTVSRSSHEQIAVVTQRIFHLMPDDNTDDDTNSVKWEIPLTFTSQANPDFEKTLPEKWMHNLTSEKSVTFTWNDGVPPADKWILFNVQQTGYYRVNYQNENWVMLTKQLAENHTVIHVLNRAQLIDDVFNLARAGELDYEIALNLSRYLIRENELVPWEAASKCLSYIDAMLSRTDAYGMWMRFISKLVEHHYKSIGFKQFPIDDDNYINIVKQSLFVAQACHLNLDDCVSTCVSLYNNWIANISRYVLSSISPSLRNTVLCKAVEKGSIKEWSSIWDKYMNSNVGTEKRSFLRALTCTEEPWILSKMLNMIMIPGGPIRFQDAPIISSGISANKMGRFILFNFVRNKITELNTLFSEARLLPAIVSSAMYNLNTEFELKQLKEFVTTHSSLLASAERGMSQLIEETEANVAWMNRNYENIKKWLESVVEK
uniref:Aminopeptidase n=1 Tax=Strigamia maritima TaxID=126957 RepID=T1IX44_STRMM